MAIPKKQFSIEIGGRTLTIETSSLAEQANAAVLAKYGETVALVTVVMNEKEAGVDYLPLKVDYEEKFYAAGKIIGSRFIRREGRPSEEAILAGRLVDRVIRPLFDDRIRRDIQVVVTILAIDEENDPEIVGLMGASAALMISDVPWAGPVAGVRVGKVGDRIVVNPTRSDIEKPEFRFEAFVAGTGDRVNMIELAGAEATEEEALHAFETALAEIGRLTAFQETLAKEAGKPKTSVNLFEPDAELKAETLAFLAPRIEEAIYQKEKKEHYARMKQLREELFVHLKEKFGEPDMRSAEFLFEYETNRIVHENILKNGKRPDGRALTDVRPLEGEVGLFTRTHGSSLFVRGNTQALAITTLAPPGAEQIIETMETTGKRRFMLHYNFPPYSVGEIGSFRGPGRREIGHGALAEKAVRPLLPSQDEFPYTIRVVSETLSSNGSSSMATVCASILSLMDAGVPIKKMAAGIAMGLMMDEAGNYKVLTDIQGPEDHHGDMDFKAAGTREGVTAIQMDVKVRGVTLGILKDALADARAARLTILAFMEGILASPRTALSQYVPTITQLKISQEKIGTLIGPGGKMINGLIRKWELAGIDIEEDGRVCVSGTDKTRVDAAVEEIRALTREFKVGDVIEGQVIKTLDFGAIVDLGGGRDGMIHVSELKNGFVKTVGEVVKVGDFVRAKVVRADEDGRIGLSLKQLEGK